MDLSSSGPFGLEVVSLYVVVDSIEPLYEGIKLLLLLLDYSLMGEDSRLTLVLVLLLLVRGVDIISSVGLVSWWCWHETGMFSCLSSIGVRLGCRVVAQFILEKVEDGSWFVSNHATSVKGLIPFPLYLMAATCSLRHRLREATCLLRRRLYALVLVASKRVGPPMVVMMDVSGAVPWSATMDGSGGFPCSWVTTLTNA